MAVSREVHVGTPTHAGIQPAKPGERDLRLAWVGVALLPVAFVLAMLTGEGLVAALGYGRGDEAVPVHVALLAGVPALLILIAPGAAAVLFGYRANRAGRAEARLPAWIGGTAAAVGLAVNMLGWIAGLILDR
jgi:hypothetical protein